MRLWAALYGMIWLVFFATLMIVWPTSPVFVPYFALVLGVGIVALAHWDFAALRATRVAGRVKRTARASFGISVLLLVLLAARSVLVATNVPVSWTFLGVSVGAALLLLELMCALAIITQAAAVAIAYDMWEDHDFEKETEPGAVPPAPRPS